MIADINDKGEHDFPYIDVVPIPAFQDNYIWRIGPSHLPGHPSVVVDPGDAVPVLTDLEALDSTLVAILLTHHHPDHVGGVRALKERWPSARVIGPASCVPHGVTEVVRHHQSIQVSEVGLSAQIIGTPGHTADHISYLCTPLPGGDAPLLFCGDTLFSAGCGRIFDGTLEQQFRSLTALGMLPLNTRVYAAHEYTLTNLRFAQHAEPHNPRIRQRLLECQQLREENQPTLPSTIAQELAINPFLRAHLPALSAHLPDALRPSVVNPMSVFQALRSWRNDFRITD